MEQPKLYVTSFGGAGGQVTGSSYLVPIEYNDKTYCGLVECGLVQGKDDYKNYFYPLNGENIDFVLVTHGHSDHFLGLPLLKRFKGKIYGTKESLIQGYDLLLDAANIYERKSAKELDFSEEQYFELVNKYNYLKKSSIGLTDEQIMDIIDNISAIRANALYTKNSVEKIREHFQEVEPYTDIKLFPGVWARFIPQSSHQNGACSIELYVGELGKNCVSISFSGDVGPKESLLYQSPENKKNSLIKYAFIEGTHGTEERPQSLEKAISTLEALVFEAIKKEKTLIIGGFSLDRLAQIQYLMNKMIDKYNIYVPIYFDSPLGFKELQHYKTFYSSSNGKSNWFKDLGKDPFDTCEVIVTNKRKDHLNAVRNLGGAKVILTAQAFGEGGRIVDYFKKYVQQPNAIFCFVAWLSPDCTSKRLLDAKKGELIEIHGERFIKNCDCVQIQGFTSHGYFSDYVQHVESFPNLQGLLVNHGDEEATSNLVEKYREIFNFSVESPDMYDDYLSGKSVIEFTPDKMVMHSTNECEDKFQLLINNM